ncbi:hypothetical protein D3C76_1585530 [compost metagenome]
MGQSLSAGDYSAGSGRLGGDADNAIHITANLARGESAIAGRCGQRTVGSGYLPLAEHQFRATGYRRRHVDHLASGIAFGANR